MVGSIHGNSLSALRAACLVRLYLSDAPTFRWVTTFGKELITLSESLGHVGIAKLVAPTLSPSSA